MFKGSYADCEISVVFLHIYVFYYIFAYNRVYMTVEQIVDIFCGSKGISQESIFIDYRKEEVVATRYMIWHYLHYKCKWSGGKISRRFKRNIPSVFRGIRVIKNDMHHDKTLRTEYTEIVKKIEEMQCTSSDNYGKEN